MCVICYIIQIYPKVPWAGGEGLCYLDDICEKDFCPCTHVMKVDLGAVVQVTIMVMGKCSWVNARKHARTHMHTHTHTHTHTYINKGIYICYITLYIYASIMNNIFVASK